MVRKPFREFQCKLCGEYTTEKMVYWKKKSQKDKRVCKKCLDKRKLAQQVAEEKSRVASYMSNPFGRYFF